MSCSTRKLVLAGLFGALIWITYLAISTPLNAVFGTSAALGFLIMPFLTLFLLVIFKQIVPDFGLATVVGLIDGLLFIPLPSFGPPGFFPKLIVVAAGAFVFEVIYKILSRRQRTACITASLIAGIFVAAIYVWSYVLFGLPGTEKIVALTGAAVGLSAIEGIFAGFIGYALYQKIKDKPFIKRMQT